MTISVQLLTSEDIVKGLLPVSANLAGEYLSAAMFEAQEIGLKGIMGATLLAALKAHETASDWAQYPAYKTLKEECQYYLAYKTIAGVLPKVSYKICNAGAVQTSDQNVQNLSREAIDAMIEDYTAKADHFCFELQKWLCAHLADFPELGGDEGEAIRANLYSAASCGIWLGGPRGQRL